MDEKLPLWLQTNFFQKHKKTLVALVGAQVNSSKVMSLLGKFQTLVLAPCFFLSPFLECFLSFWWSLAGFSHTSRLNS
jgi:hypothetical protein